MGEDLLSAGKHFELPSGAKAFVRPEQYDAARKEAELRRGLTPQHVLVSQDYEKLVTEVIQCLPCKSKVRVQAKAKVPTGLASEAVYSGLKVKIDRTFIHIEIESSLRPTASGKECTV